MYSRAYLRTAQRLERRKAILDVIDARRAQLDDQGVGRNIERQVVNSELIDTLAATRMDEVSRQVATCK